MLPYAVLLLAPALATAIGVEFASVNGSSYDYVIIGGGTAGLVLAARLSEDQHRTVAVLEAGNAHFNDSLIDAPGNVFEYLGNPEYDWAFSTVPQPYAHNMTNVYDRGKGLGGSSAINYLVYGRPASGEIDAWEGLGNKGWNWSSVWKYIKKSERFEPPTEQVAQQNNYTYIADFHGYDGPIQNSYTKTVPSVQYGWLDAVQRLGVKALKDGLGGMNVGAWNTPDNMDHRFSKRSYSATAYYEPVRHRSNLKVVTGALVSRILTHGGGKSHTSAVATGVEFYLNGTRQVVHAAQEVILSAGCIQSPKILELSGIGDPKILNGLGIPVVVDLPGVGDGITDHLGVYSNWELKDNSSVSLDDREIPGIAAQQMAQWRANGTGLYALGFNSMTMVPLQTVTNASRAEELIARQRADAEAESKIGLKKLKKLQLEYLSRPEKHPLLEISLAGLFDPDTNSTKEPGKKYYTAYTILLLPWSRGTVHAQSTNYTVQPRIDPGFLSNPFDVEAIINGVRFVEKIFQQPEWTRSVRRQVAPALNATDDELREYVRQYCTTPFHTVGSTKMLPRSDGGVVSPELIVHGTKNLRVIDSGIFPMQVSNHPQSLLYGVAEKASDIIRGIDTVH